MLRLKLNKNNTNKSTTIFDQDSLNNLGASKNVGKPAKYHPGDETRHHIRAKDFSYTSQLDGRAHTHKKIFLANTSTRN